MLSNGCRSDKAPDIPICTLDGFGGGDCVYPGDVRKFLPPSEMKNYWATDQASMAAFSSWCFGITAQEARLVMQMRLQHRDNLAVTK